MFPVIPTKLVPTNKKLPGIILEGGGGAILRTRQVEKHPFRVQDDAWIILNRALSCDSYSQKIRIGVNPVILHASLAASCHSVDSPKLRSISP